jgi:hypothetical protein
MHCNTLTAGDVVSAKGVTRLSAITVHIVETEHSFTLFIIWPYFILECLWPNTHLQHMVNPVYQFGI